MGQGQGVQQLEERYFMQKVKLGQGSFGTVWRAVDRQQGCTVAIKELNKASLPKRNVSRADIEREIKMMKACPHENVTRLCDTFEDATSIYLALEYCDNGDFGDKIKERGMAMTEKEMAGWIRQMCAAVNALHANNICHRDIKPDNFMVSGTSMLKLADFGLATELSQGKLLMEKCGTPAFMAPEQHNLPKRSIGYGFPADMWAVGVSMYMVMFGGKHPFLTERGSLDDSKLLTGELDFRESNGLGGIFQFGAMGLRFSEDARKFCKKMVEPDGGKRMVAKETPKSAWLQRHTSPTDAAAAEAPKAAEVVKTPSARQELSRVTTPRGRSSNNERQDGDFHSPDRAVVELRAMTPGPEGRKALAQAEILKNANSNLQAELDLLKRKETDLALGTERLKEHNQQLQRQRTQDLQTQTEKLLEQEKQLQRVEREKNELEKKTKALEQEALSDGSKNTSRGKRAEVRVRSGARCRYESGNYGWLSAVVESFNESDSTYNLDVRPHAALDRIAPMADILASEAWPAGTTCQYQSSSANAWLPAVVLSFNESDSTYNLDVRDHADPDLMRVRIGDKVANPIRRSSVSSTASTCASAVTSANRVRSSRTNERQSTFARGNSSSSDSSGSDTKRDGTKDAPLKLSDLAKVQATASDLTAAPGQQQAAAARRVGAGDRCVVGNGLALIESLNDGIFTVKTADRQRSKVTCEKLRAPAEAKFSWPAGTKVAYQSSSLNGKWIDAAVVSFNIANSTYNLDVRQEAQPDKVRPR